MSRLLIAVKSCKRDRMAGHHEIIRKTWGKDLPFSVDLCFFTGEDNSENMPLPPDEVHLRVPDDYMSLPWKTKAIAQWSVNERYAHTFLCDTDTYVVCDKLIRCGFEQFDFAGR